MICQKDDRFFSTQITKVFLWVPFLILKKTIIRFSHYKNVLFGLNVLLEYTRYGTTLYDLFVIRKIFNVIDFFF